MYADATDGCGLGSSMRGSLLRIIKNKRFGPPLRYTLIQPVGCWGRSRLLRVRCSLVNPSKMALTDPSMHIAWSIPMMLSAWTSTVPTTPGSEKPGFGFGIAWN